MTTVAEVIRAAIPDADEGLCDHILWGRTPYPMGRVTAHSLYKAASGFKRATEKGIRLCDHCDNIALSDRFECRQCRDALDNARAA